MALLGSIALCVGLRLPFFDVPLGLDEGGFAYVAGQWTRHGSSLYGDMWVDRPPALLALFHLVGAHGAGGVRTLGLLAAVALTLLVTAVARTVSGRRAAATAGLLAATLGSSVALRAVATPGELLAAVPATGAVLCGMLALRRADGRWLAVAGALAATAPLVKQSALDAAVALAVLLAVAWHGRRTGPWRAWWPLAAAVGALLPVLALEGYERWAAPGDGAMSYALLGFRVDALRHLAGTSGSFAASLAVLGLHALGAVIPVLLVAGLRAIRGVRSDATVRVTLLAWAGAALVGVLAGGSYWPHYLIQLAAPLSVLAALGLADVPRLRRAALVAVVAINVTVAGGTLAVQAHTRPEAPELAVAGFLRAHAHSGDTDYVLWARTDVLYYAGLPTPFPYAWSLMDRAGPEVPAQLRALLGSPRAPTWLVAWQRPDAWGLDPNGRIARTIARRYACATVVAGHAVYHLRATRA